MIRVPLWNFLTHLSEIRINFRGLLFNKKSLQTFTVVVEVSSANLNVLLIIQISADTQIIVSV